MNFTTPTSPRDYFRLRMPSWRRVCAGDWAMVAVKVLLPYAAMGLVLALA
ncbi:MAG TPA: hypothetical protein VNO84_03705 [Burkholderiaceae bacterium]|nr:hypothetical protein [Burkholderiaceae bacterium]